MSYLNDHRLLIRSVGMNPNTSPLTQRIKVQPFVLTEMLALAVANRSWLIRNESAKKIAHPDFANETDSLAIPFSCSRQAALTRYPTDLGFVKFTYGKSRRGDLMLF